MIVTANLSNFHQINNIKCNFIGYGMLMWQIVSYFNLFLTGLWRCLQKKYGLAEKIALNLLTLH
jgi:hypothetical protein